VTPQAAAPTRRGNQLDQKPLILLVDDEVDITEICGMYLEFCGFDVMTANSVAAAFEKIDGRLPDLIVSDCMMPLVDGIEFSRRLQARPDTCDIPLILSSGAPHLHDLDGAAYDLFLLKPVAMLRLVDEIRRLLS
jgi:CheY-like chemotaxis protein